MKKLLWGCLCAMTTMFAGVTAVSTSPEVIDEIDSMHRIKSAHIRPVRPIVKPVIVREYYNFYKNVVSNCDEYIRIIEQKDQEIEMLKKEIESLKGKEYTKLQKNLKRQYEQELKKFDERKSGIKTKNSLDVSDQ